MADDFQRSLSEVMAGYQGMSSTISHFGGPTPTPIPGSRGSGGQPIGPGGLVIPNPPPPVPMTPPPMPMPPPPVPPYTPPGAPAPAPAYGMGGGWEAGMQAAQQYSMNPMFASYMDPSMNFPQAGLMTPSSAGMFRQAPVSDVRRPRPAGVPGGVSVPDALLPVQSLQRTTPMLQFSRPYDAGMYEGMEASRLLQQGYAGYSNAAAGNLISAAATPLFMGAGTAVGGYLGGPQGAVSGGNIAMLAAQGAQYIPGVREATAAAFRPAIERRAEAIQTQFGSRRFMVGAGQDTDISGTGLSTAASQEMTYKFGEMARESGGELTRQDFVNMMQAGGEQGLMDFAQNADQIADTVKNMSRVLGTFAEITGDPDFQNNIKKMAQLRRLGLGMNQMEVAMKNMDQYARMAGMDVDQMLQQGGMQGAAIYQGAGLSTAQGLQAGGMGAAQAKQLAASGAFTEEQLSLYGGESGIGQKLTQMNAGFLSGVSQPLLGYLAQRGENGEVSLNKDRVNQLRTGAISYEEALRRSSGADPRLTEALSSQRVQKELTAQLGNQLGAEGTQRAAIEQMMSMANDTPGLDVLQFAEMAMGPEAAAIVQRMGGKDFQRNMIAQMEKEKERRQFDAYQQNKGAVGVDVGMLARLGINMPDRGPLEWMQQEASGLLARHEEGNRLAGVGTKRFERMGVGGPTRYISPEEQARIQQRYGTAGSRGMSVSGATAFAGPGAPALALAQLASDGQVQDEANRGVYRPMMSDEAAVLAEVSGDSIYGQLADNVFSEFAREADLATGGTGRAAARTQVERGKKEGRGRTILKATRTAGNAGISEMQGMEGALREKMGDKAYLRATRALGKEIRGNVGVFGTDLLTEEQIASSMGITPEQLTERYTEDEIAGFISGGAGNAGGKGETYRKEAAARANEGIQAGIGERYLAGQDTGTLDAALGDFGFGDYEDLSKADKSAIEKLTMGDAVDSMYLMLAALEAKGSTWLGDRESQELVMLLRGQLESEDKPEVVAAKLREAKKQLASMSPDEIEALVSRAVDIVGGDEAIAAARKGKGREHVQKRLKGLGDVTASISQENKLKKAGSQLEKAGLGGAGSVKDLARKLKGATQEESAALRKAGLGGALDIAKQEGFDISSEESLTQLLEGMDAGTQLDLSASEGASSPEVQQQQEAIDAQRAFFSRLNDAMGANTSKVVENTQAIDGLTKALQGESAQEKMRQQRGD